MTQVFVNVLLHICVYNYNLIRHNVTFARTFGLGPSTYRRLNIFVLIRVRWKLAGIERRMVALVQNQTLDWRKWPAAGGPGWKKWRNSRKYLESVEKLKKIPNRTFLHTYWLFSRSSSETKANHQISRICFLFGTDIGTNQLSRFNHFEDTMI